MSIQKQFEEFYNKIRLTPTQKEDARTKYTSVCKTLHNYYYPTIEYTGDTKLLIGSYGKHTHIRPPRDIDVIFIMPPGKFEQYNDNTSNKQSQLLQDIRKILVDRYPTTDKISAWGKIVLIEFGDNTHSVELVPAWEQSDGSFMIPNSENGGSWEYWNPKEGIEKIRKSNDDNNQKTIPLIRMIKKWTDNCTVALKSFQIEEKIVGFINSTNCNLEYSALVKDFFQNLVSTTYDVSVKSHVLTALNRATKACELEANDKLEAAADEWKKVFGDDFPKGGVTRMTTFPYQEQVTNLQAQYPSLTEEYLERDYQIPMELRSLYSVKIDALVAQDGFRAKMLSVYLFERLPLIKRKSLTFQILRNNVPQPYTVKWKVRNYGDEADAAGDLRGEISDDTGYNQKKETTKYKGQHYVECYVIKDRRCVALDKILVPIQQ